MSHHPSKSSNETFIGNTAGGEIPDYMKVLKTVRVGYPAYDIDGKVLKGYGAIFIDNSDMAALDRIQMARLRRTGK